MKISIVLGVMLVVLSGCASMNNAMTPSVQVSVDPFDGVTHVIQEPISSASSISEAWHTLGFEWIQSSPNVIFLTVGTNGFQNIQNVVFNVDGKIIDSATTASFNTDLKYDPNAPLVDKRSFRRFAIDYDSFVTVANGNDVKMKVVGIDTYTVSSFGKSKGVVTVNQKFPDFLLKVKSLK